MTDFLKLLAAQFTHQDLTNPTDNTEFISELAQFSSLQAMNALTVYADRQYASALVGKNVQVRKTDTTGQTVFDTGVVSYADFSSTGSSSIVVNGNVYDPADVTRILSDSGKTDPAENGGDSGKTAAGGDSSSAG